MKIFMMGNFGSTNQAINGQSIKTITIFNILATRYVVNIFDISSQISFCGMIKHIQNIFTSQKYVVMPGPKGVVFFLPIITLFAKILKRPLVYIAVGGWIDELSINSNFIRVILSKQTRVIVETNYTKNKLNSIGLNNVVSIPNAKKYLPNRPNLLTINNHYISFVYLSRITESKGVFELISAFEVLHEKFPNIKLNFYGPVDSKINDIFYEKINKSRNIKYLGTVKPSDAPKSLSNNQVFVLPTYYPGECFPGALIDSFYAGLPIITTDWKSNSEIVKDGYNGILVKPKDYISLSCAMELMVVNPPLVHMLSQNSYASYAEYSYEKISNSLLAELED